MDRPEIKTIALGASVLGAWQAQAPRMAPLDHARLSAFPESAVQRQPALYKRRMGEPCAC